MNLHSALSLSSDHCDVIAFIGAGGKSTAMFRLAGELVARGERVITATTTRIAAEQIRSAPIFVPVTHDYLPVDRIRSALNHHHHCLLIGRDSAERDMPRKKAGLLPDQIDALVDHAAGLDLSAILIEADGSRMLPAKVPAAHEPVVPASVTLVVSLVGMDAIGLPIADPYVHRPERMRSLLGLTQARDEHLTPSRVAWLLRHEDGGHRGVPENVRSLSLLNKADSLPRLASARLIACQLGHLGEQSLIGAMAASRFEPIRERWGATAAIVLAGGEGARMGQAKQLVAVDGEAMVVRATRTALQSGASMVFVITGAHAGPVTRLLVEVFDEALRIPDPPSAQGASVCRTSLRILHNDLWQEGQAASIRAAINALPMAVHAAIFLPADQPFMPSSLLRRLQRAWRSGANLAAPMVGDQVRGAPALFDRQYWPQLLALHGDIGARGILQQNAGQIAGIVTDAELLRDVDHNADRWP